MSREIVDLLLVNPGNRVEQFANLAPLATVAQPLGIAMLAAYVREQGISVAIFDAEAYGLTPVEAADQIEALYNPPLLVGLSAFTTKMTSAGHIMRELKRRWSETKMMCGGHHPSAIPERTLREEATDFVIKGEGFYPVTELMARLKKGEHCYDIKGVWLWRPDGTVHPGGQAPGPQKLDELPFAAWDLLPMGQYKAHHWQAWGRGEIDTTGFSLIHTSLGCPFTCLRGDTLVNTMYGEIPIEVLAKSGERSVPVYTYKDGEIVIADAINIKKLGANKKLVRVAFDDGTNMDVTPDHKFLVFTINTPQNGDVVETAVEAQFLEPGDRLRAIAIRHSATGRKTVEWRRRGAFNAIMVMEYLLKRKLKKGEKVHHDDHDQSNDFPDNLILCDSWLDHVRNYHPEVSARMRVNNPMHNKKTARRVAAANKANHKSGKTIPFFATKRGKQVVKTLARKRMLSDDNPMKNPEIARSPKRRRKESKRMRAIWVNKTEALAYFGRAEVNHRVVSVTPLIERDDVYCMEVPATGWFFANNVLVHNCSYCSVNVVYERHTVRYRSPVKVVDEIEHLINVYGVQHFEFIDDTFTTNRKHVEAICDEIISRKLGDKINAWAFSRVDRADPRFLAKMKAAGINWVFMGLESGNDTVLLGVDKGQTVSDIHEAVDKVHAAGIHIGGNYVFGLPEDTHASMDQTFALARDLNTEYANFFIMMSYPGSFMHDALPPADALPKKWSQYGFFAPDALPLRNATVSAADILERRDRAFKEYFGGERYQGMVQEKFGAETLEFLRSQVLSKQLVRQRTVI